MYPSPYIVLEYTIVGALRRVFQSKLHPNEHEPMSRWHDLETQK